MKTRLLLALLLASLAAATPPLASLASAKATNAAKLDPDSRARMRRHLHHQAKVRLRQYRRR